MSTGHNICLIVDDEPDMCWALERILLANGVPCATAFDAASAMALAARQPFRMAFLDAKLPDLDGLDLARWLQRNCPGIRIVLVSGCFYQDDATITGAVQSGLIAAFVAKPFVHDEIMRHVRPSQGVPGSDVP